MEATGQSSGEWPLWRPLLISRVAMPCVVVPSVVYFIVRLVAGLIRDPRMDPFGALILLFLVLGSLGFGVISCLMHRNNAMTTAGTGPSP